MEEQRRPDEPRRRVMVTGVVLDDAGRALVMRRRDNGRWEAPGGRLELGERVQDGVAREVEEETGVHVEAVRLSGIYNNMPSGVVAIVFRCRAVGGEAGPSEEAAEVRWATPAEVSDLMAEAFAVRVLDAYRDDGPHVRDHDGVRVLPPGG